MNAALWILQIFLAVAFFAFGGMKLGLSEAALAAKLGWVASAPKWLPSFIGATEVLGAIGRFTRRTTRRDRRRTSWLGWGWQRATGWGANGWAGATG